MRIYWNIKSVPELAGLSKQEREQVLKAFRSKAFRHWQTWVAFVALIVWLLVVVSLVDSIRGGQWACKGSRGLGRCGNTSLVGGPCQHPNDPPVHTRTAQFERVIN